MKLLPVFLITYCPNEESPLHSTPFLHFKDNLFQDEIFICIIVQRLSLLLHLSLPWSDIAAVLSQKKSFNGERLCSEVARNLQTSFGQPQELDFGFFGDFVRDKFLIRIGEVPWRLELGVEVRECFLHAKLHKKWNSHQFQPLPLQVIALFLQQCSKPLFFLSEIYGNITVNV